MSDTENNAPSNASEPKPAKRRVGNPDKTIPYRFPKGRSGNPGGRPKKKPITELYEKILADGDFVPEIEAAIRKMLTSGRMAAQLQLKEMAERVEGKVKQPVEVDGEIRVSLAQAIKKGRDRSK